LTYLLDTSAIIGWLERSDSSLPSLIAASDSALYHPVALGELYAGIERAGTSPEREMRTNTLRFTVQRLEQIGEHALPAEQFGFLTSRFGRKLSHNGYWTVATAIAAGGLTLVTEDVKLFDIVTSTQFLEALGERAWLPPPCELVESQAVR
jgi:predicted nucleic acid-binding protein